MKLWCCHQKKETDRSKVNFKYNFRDKQCLWGNNNEMKAIDQYYKLKKAEGFPVTVCAQIGFVLNPEYPWLGASPDFLIGDSKEESKYGIGTDKMVRFCFADK